MILFMGRAYAHIAIKKCKGGHCLENKELAKFNYLNETKVRRVIYSIALLFVVVMLVYLIYDACQTKFDIETVLIILLFVPLILLFIVQIIGINLQYIVTFYEDSIDLNNDRVMNTDIEFIGVVHYSGGRGGHDDFEVHSQGKVYTIRLSKKCRKYFKVYCEEKHIKNNLK